MKIKLLLAALIIACHSNAQTREQNERNGRNADKQSKASNDSEKKADTTQIELILYKLEELKKEIDQISSKISPSEDGQTYKDSLRLLREENENQKSTIITLDSESTQWKIEAQAQKKAKENFEKQSGESYSNLTNNLIKFGTIVPKIVLDSISKNLIKKNPDFDLFKTQSSDLKFAQDLLSSSSIKLEDYNKLKIFMSGRIEPTKFPEQNKLFESLKTQYNEFNKYGKLLTTLLGENSAITDLKYRRNLIDFDFPTKEACLTIPYLAKKLNEAYTNNKTSIDLVFP